MNDKEKVIKEAENKIQELKELIAIKEEILNDLLFLNAKLESETDF